MADADLTVGIKAAANVDELIAAIKKVNAEILRMARQGQSTAGLHGEVQQAAHSAAWRVGASSAQRQDLDLLFKAQQRELRLQVLDRNRQQPRQELTPEEKRAKATKRLLKEAETTRGYADDPKFIAATERAATASQNLAANMAEARQRTGEYTLWTAKLVAARKAEEADLQQLLAGDDDYRNAQARAAAALKTQQANLQERLADRTQPEGVENLDASKRLAVAQAQQAADLESELAGNKEYRAAKTRSAAAQAKEASFIELNLASESAEGKRYQAAQRRSALAQARQAALLQEGLAGDSRLGQQYRAARSRSAAAEAQLAASLQEDLANRRKPAGKTYLDAQQRLAVAQARQAADLQRSLAGNSTYLKSRAQVTAAQARQAARVESDLASNSREGVTYRAAQRRSAVAQARQAASLQESLAGDDRYLKARRRSAIAQAQQAANLERGLLKEGEYTRATADAAIFRARQQAKIQSVVQADEEYRSATATTAIARRRASAQVQRQVQETLAGDSAYLEDTARAARARAQQSAEIRSTLAVDQEYLTATAQAARARQEEAARTQILQRTGAAGSGLVLPGQTDPEAKRVASLQGTELLAEQALVKRIEADNIAAINARKVAAGDARALQASIERRRAETDMRKVQRDQMRQLIHSGQAGGTRFQRIQALASPSGKAPDEFATLRQAFTQRLTTSAGYMAAGAISGIALYSTVEAIREANKLQEEFAALQGQMEALGRASAFPQVRDEIKEISATTGVAATDVANFVERLIGLYGDVEEATAQAAAATKLAVVSQTDLSTVQEETVPILESLNTNMTHLGDTAVYVHDQFGIAEASTLQFLGETASLAGQAGFSMEELAVVGARAQNTIGKSANVAGEQFAKVIGTLRQNLSEIMDVYRQAPETAGFVDQMTSSAAAGDTAGIFRTILASYGQLNKEQQQSLVYLLGSRREWALITGFLRDGARLSTDMASAQGDVRDNAGALEERFAKVSATIERGTQQLRQQFANLVENVLASGLGDAVANMLNLIGGLMGAINELIGALGRLNDFTKIGPFDDSGMLVWIVAAVGTIALLQKSYQGLMAARRVMAISGQALTVAEGLLSGAQATTTGTTAIQTDALIANTGAKQANAVASGEAAAAGAGAGLLSAQGIPFSALPPPPVGAAARLGLGGQLKSLASRAFPTLTKLAPTISALAGPAAAAAASAYVSTNWAAEQARSEKGFQLFGGRQGPEFLRNIPVWGDVLAEGKIGGLGLSKQTEAISKDLQDVSDERLAQLAESYGGFWTDLQDKISESILGIDMPKTLFEKEANRRVGAGGRALIQDLEKTGLVKDFVDLINENNVKVLEGFLKQAGAQDFAAQFDLLNDEGTLDKAKLTSALPQIRELADKGDDAANKFLEALGAVDQGVMGEFRKKVADLINGTVESEAVRLAGGVEAFLSAQYDPEGALQRGLINPTQYENILQGKIAQLRSDITSGSVDDPEQAYQELNRRILELEQYQNQRVEKRIALLDQRAKIRGGRGVEVAQLQNALTRVKTTKGTDAQLEQLPDLLDKSVAAWEKEVENLRDPMERYLRRKAGVQLDPEIQRLETIQRALDSQEVAPLLQLMGSASSASPADTFAAYIQLAQEAGVTVEQYIRDYATGMLEMLQAMPEGLRDDKAIEYWKKVLDFANSGALTGIDAVQSAEKDAQDAQLKFIEESLRETESQIALERSQGGQGSIRQAALDLREAQAKLASVQARINAGEGGEIDNELREAQAAVNDAVRASTQITQDAEIAMLEWQVVFAQGDPIAETAAQIRVATQTAKNLLARLGGDTREPEYQKALQDIAQLEYQQVQNRLDVLQAQMELDAFGSNRNPVAAAQSAIDAARVAVANARGDADRIRAALQLKQAQRDLDDALEAAAVSLVELEAGLLEVDQYPVQAAERRVAEAQRQLTRAEQLNLGDEAIRSAMLALAQARSTALDAGVSEQERMIDFLLEMGQITTAEAVERLQVEAAKYRVNSEKWMALQSKIHSLQQQAAQDLQYNLPSELALPTLYEARRLDQSYGMGIGYQDNRQMSITIEVNGAQDPSATATQVMAAFNAAASSAPVYGALAGVGG